MQQNRRTTGSMSGISAYLSRATLPSQQETLGSVVMEILRSGRILNRKIICLRLLARMDTASSPDEEQHIQTLIGLLFRG